MSNSYHEALATLYQAPHEAFVAERKRLAAQLKAGGDAAGAAQLAKLARPSVSAWVVNQLWWHEPATFREMFATAEQLREGQLAASGPHRQAMAQLVARARKLLGEGGHAASEATLRRVQMTLSGLSAAGGFAPEPEGALTKDRDPPGVEAFGMMAFGDAAQKVQPEATREAPARGTHSKHASEERSATAEHRAEAEHRAAAERRAVAERREKEAAERKRIAEERARRRALRLELERAVSEAERELTTRQGERERAASELARAERELELARAAVETAQARLATVKKE